MSLKCEKCGEGKMLPKRIYRFSGCLVMIGYFLVIPSLLLMLGVIGFSILGTSASTTAIKSGFDGSNQDTLNALKNLGIPQNLLDEFQKKRTISEKSMSILNSEQKIKVQRILNNDLARKSGTAMAASSFAVCGGAFTLMSFLTGIPAFIIGFLLILKRNVWACSSCGYFYDRV